MRRKLGIFLVTALTLSGLSLWLTMGSAGAIKQPTTLTYIEKETQSRFVDIEPLHQPNIGDNFVFSSKLLQNGNKAGFDGGQCLIVHRKPVRLNCVATLKISGGNIMVQTLFSEDQKVFRLSITGGTGDFRNARGDGTIEELKGEDSRITLNILP